MSRSLLGIIIIIVGVLLIVLGTSRLFGGNGDTLPENVSAAPDAPISAGNPQREADTRSGALSAAQG